MSAAPEPKYLIGKKIVMTTEANQAQFPVGSHWYVTGYHRKHDGEMPWVLELSSWPPKRQAQLNSAWVDGGYRGQFWGHVVDEPLAICGACQAQHQNWNDYLCNDCRKD